MNGSQFTSYKSLISNNFTSSDINPIYKDNKGNLWVGVYGGGIYMIEGKTNKVTEFNPGVTKSYVVCMKEISPGVFWLGIDGGLLEFNSRTGKFSNPLPDNRTARNLKNISIWDILKDKNLLYIAASNGIFVYDLKKRSIHQFSFSKNDSAADETNWLMSPIRLKNGEIWAVWAYHGINKISYNEANGNITVSNILPDSVIQKNSINLQGRYRFFQDSKGSLWIANQAGLYKTNPQTYEINAFKLFENIAFPEFDQSLKIPVITCGWGPDMDCVSLT